MEDSGYMARAAFIMDKFMHTIGLHGKSFIPMLMGMGCNVPAIMATRILESDRDRIRTILLTPLISCSARLPIYVLFAGALFPRQAGTVVFLFNFVFGILAFFIVGFVLKKTLFSGPEYPFVMELPPYRLPTLRSVMIHMWQKSEHYLKKMGGVVLIFSVVLWGLSTFPRDRASAAEFDGRIAGVSSDSTLTQAERHQRVTRLKAEKTSAAVKRTYVGRIGRALEPTVRPLGLDWRAAVALVTGFVAKEMVVSSLGVLYAVGGDADAESQKLRQKIAGNFTPLSGLAFMMVVLLYTPCVVALVTVVRELRSWKWSLFSVAYQVILAWVAAFVVYQGGRLLGLQ
jgi:ferrous iron transport protein B